MKFKKFEYVILGSLLSAFAICTFFMADMVFQTKLTPSFVLPEGYAQGDARIVPRLKAGKACSFIYLAPATTSTCTLDTTFLNTELHSLKITIPTFAATSPTATLTLKDPDGSTLYSLAAIAETTTTYIPLSRPLTAGSTFTVLLTTTAGTGGGTATLTPWIYSP